MRGLGFSIGVVIGAASLFSYQALGKGQHPTAFPVLERKGFTLAYDSRGKIPLWTHEHLTKESLAKNSPRDRHQFQEDPDIYPPHRSTLADYAKSGYDRGHVVPAGDVRYSDEALKESFYLSNICPQNATCNRGIWGQLEKKVRELLATEESLDVITGSLFLPHDEADGHRYVTYRVIGKSDVAVPTHLFKVIKGKTKTWAYVIPNGPVTGALEDFKFSLDELERVSGIQIKNAFRS